MTHRPACSCTRRYWQYRHRCIAPPRWRRLMQPSAAAHSTCGCSTPTCRMVAAPTCCHVCAMARSEEHTSELQSLMRISYAVFCLKKKKTNKNQPRPQQTINNTPTTHKQMTTILQTTFQHLYSIQTISI